MQDSYKELINEALVIELIDCEVNWIDWYKQINAFCNVKSEEYEYWKDKKILIKDVASKQDTAIDHYTYLKDLSLFITDDNLQDLIRRKDSLDIIANSLNSLRDDWGRDHEYFGGDYYTYTEKGIVSPNGHSCKFNLQKLFNIIRLGCMIKNEGSSYSNKNYNATSFYTSEGGKVYVTADFLYLLQSIFELRKKALDVAIQRLTIKPTPRGVKGKDEKKYPSAVIMMVAIIINKIEGESFLPAESIDFEERVKLTIDAIYNKLELTVGNGIRNNFNPDKQLTKTHRGKVVELLDSLGFKEQARAFKHRVNNR